MKLSIVIVFCDKDAHLVHDRLQEINSFFKDTDYEVILMDNRADKTTPFLTEFNNTKIIAISKNNDFQPLQFYARYLSVDYCLGDYVWFIDPDDQIVDNNYSEILHGVNSNWDIIVFSYYKNGQPVFLDTNITTLTHVEDLLCLPNNIIFQYYNNMTYSSWNKWYKTSMLKSAFSEISNSNAIEDISILEDNFICYLTLYNSNTVKYLKNYYIYNVSSSLDNDNISYEIFVKQTRGIQSFYNICISIFNLSKCNELKIIELIKNTVSMQVIKLALQKDIVTALQCYHFLRSLYTDVNNADIQNYILTNIDSDNIDKVISAVHNLDNNIELQVSIDNVEESDIVINTFNFFGYLEKHPIAQACIESWKKAMPNATIKIWTFEELEDIIMSYGFTKFAYDNKRYTYIGDIARLFLALSTPNFLYLDLDTFITGDLLSLLKKYTSLTLGFSSESGMLRTNFGCIIWEQDFCGYIFNTFQKYLLPEYDSIDSIDFLLANDACLFSEDVLNTAYDRAVSIQLVDNCAIIHDNMLNKYCKHVGLSIIEPLSNPEISNCYYAVYTSTMIASLAEWSQYLKNKGIDTIYIIKADSRYIDNVNGVEFRFVVLPSNFSDQEAIDLVYQDIISIRNNLPINLINESFESYWSKYNGV